jgi:hypothetical protein
MVTQRSVQSVLDVDVVDCVSDFLDDERRLNGDLGSQAATCCYGTTGGSSAVDGVSSILKATATQNVGRLMRSDNGNSGDRLGGAGAEISEGSLMRLFSAMRLASMRNNPSLCSFWSNLTGRRTPSAIIDKRGSAIVSSCCQSVRSYGARVASVGGCKA